MASVIWHGTLRLSTCAGHHMLSEDQRALEGLLFARRIAGRLRREEGLDTHQRVIAGSRRFCAVLLDQGKPQFRKALWNGMQLRWDTTEASNDTDSTV